MTADSNGEDIPSITLRPLSSSFNTQGDLGKDNIKKVNQKNYRSRQNTVLLQAPTCKKTCIVKFINC